MPPPTRTDIFIQRFDRALNFLGPETQVNTNSSGKHVCANVATSAEGRFLVVWAARDPGATGIGVFGRQYDEVGTPLGPEFQINSIAAEQTPIDPAMAMNKSGAFVVTWQASHMFQPG
ncbi:MAG: hypothetical protein GTO42_09275 [Candidatus Latescibacteria bacterium]|nr:hypothetical protein [Candidatus Latescibacterota bacterium]NIO02320.1 hypothetical protein [Candidatus Latescibacterota bacterium]NIO29851.1 hypothetical protein [Candidatus Latescibacterota bacterium]NIO57463.1 hypothetical protein [Candidatus Latescibacterota bacterium]NIT03177.1 hypothetical protein [Candidatus Latescibacterota bacterium]